MIEQMVIAGSGYGTRMSDKINKKHTKCLIEISGRPLLDIQIDWAIQAGITKFCISAKPEDREQITKICKKYNVNFVLRTGEKTFQEVPSLFKDILDDRFIFVGGHTPILTSHLIEMIKASNNFKYIVSSYNNKLNPIPKKERILVEYSPERYKLIYDKDFLTEDHFYLKNPYIIDKSIINQTKKDDFIKTQLFYIFKEWENGTSVKSVINPFPVEFNTDNEFQITKKFILRYLKS